MTKVSREDITPVATASRLRGERSMAIGPSVGQFSGSRLEGCG